MHLDKVQRRFQSDLLIVGPECSFAWQLFNIIEAAPILQIPGNSFPKTDSRLLQSISDTRLIWYWSKNGIVATWQPSWSPAWWRPPGQLCCPPREPPCSHLLFSLLQPGKDELVGETCEGEHLSEAVCPPETRAGHPRAPGVGKGCHAPVFGTPSQWLVDFMFWPVSFLSVNKHVPWGEEEGHRPRSHQSVLTVDHHDGNNLNCDYQDYKDGLYFKKSVKIIIIWKIIMIMTTRMKQPAISQVHIIFSLQSVGEGRDLSWSHFLGTVLFA